MILLGAFWALLYVSLSDLSVCVWALHHYTVGRSHGALDSPFGRNSENLKNLMEGGRDEADEERCAIPA